MIDNLDRYKFVTSQITYYAERMKDSFKLLIQLTTAIAGGFVYIKTLPAATQVAPLLALAPYLVAVISLFTILQIGFDLRGQYGYRKAEANLLKNPDLAPRIPGSILQESVMMLGAGTIGFGGFFLLR